jgi:hypothetical protein
MTTRPYCPYEDGPFWRRKASRKNRRTVTVPEHVSAHVALVFAEMARQGRSYDEVESASGIRRPTVKQWRRKNAPGWDSLTAVLNSLGWRYLPVPAHIEALPPNVAAKIAEVSALAKMELGEVFAAAALSAARQLIASEGSASILAEIDAERSALQAAIEMRRKPANDNTPRSSGAAA